MEANPLKWHGGKRYLADRIIAMMPPHVHYVEPYFGGGAVLFRKPCEGISEVVNDLNADLINFWNVLASESHFERFRRKCEATPFSEELWNRADVCCEDMSDDPVSAAWGFFVRYRQSRQGLGRDFATLSRNRTRRGMNEQVSSWLSAIEGLSEAHERLRRVVILNGEAIDVIRSQDGPNTLFYLDPPYLPETRAVPSAYEHEMTWVQHADLLLAISAANFQGRFILSGYHSELYDTKATQQGWHCTEIKIDNKSSSSKTKEIKTECLWTNYVPEVSA